MEVQNVERQMMYYHMSMECLAITGQIVSAFALLARADASGLLSGCPGMCYPIIRTLCAACCAVNDVNSASRAQAAMEHFGARALPTIATGMIVDAAIKSQDGGKPGTCQKMSS
eukprot:gnl/TRDRNA2_/TRDRNA2_35032_c0_seq1.p2 gnl/TRDRNA2_/TRDRNA2_35032_c0~~gnl/TRDRNA2_/TRDRNA2_35032_c0_seq1.p2  ORF type:complete len:114 (+),score=13.41 gnl/TRDRNA2_/TRDRNA2_35032_c0_seq1:293-634(+)